MEVSLFLHGAQIRHKVLAHRQQTVSTSEVGLTNIPEPHSEIRRVVLRNLNQPIQWRADEESAGSADAVDAMYAYADDLVVLDVSDLETFRMILAPDATADADVRIIYLN